MLDFASYTSKVGQSDNYDAFCCEKTGDALMLALCDGGTDALAAQRCAQSISEKLLSGNTPLSAICELMNGVIDMGPRTITIPVCVVDIHGDACQWANLGNVRLYHFSSGKIGQVSVDDTADIAGIRMSPARSVLTAPPEDNGVPVPHVGRITLEAGDAILVCSGDFWKYVFETEMEIDLLKAEDAGHWLDQMLVRLMSRSHMEGGHLTACAIQYTNDL